MYVVLLGAFRFFSAAFRLVLVCLFGGIPPGCVLSCWRLSGGVRAVSGGIRVVSGGIRAVSGGIRVVSGALFGGIRYVGAFPFHVWQLLA